MMTNETNQPAPYSWEREEVLERIKRVITLIAPLERQNEDYIWRPISRSLGELAEVQRILSVLPEVGEVERLRTEVERLKQLLDAASEVSRLRTTQHLAAIAERDSLSAKLSDAEKALKALRQRADDTAHNMSLGDGAAQDAHRTFAWAMSKKLQDIVEMIEVPK